MKMRMEEETGKPKKMPIGLRAFVVYSLAFIFFDLVSLTDWSTPIYGRTIAVTGWHGSMV